MTPSTTLRTRPFTCFTLTQFFGAFNDNVFKQIILLFSLTYLAVDRQGLATVLFALPFILFSGLAGQLSERYAKSTIMRLAKIGEAVIMALAVVGFYLQSEVFLLATLTLMGAQSAIFGPAKYGVIPELIHDDKMVDANGVVQMTTFLAIILGQALAGGLMDRYQEDLYLGAMYCVVIAIIGIMAVYPMGVTQPNRPEITLEYNPFSRVWQSLKFMAKDKPLFMSLIAGSFFFYSGAMVQLTVNNYGINLLNLGPMGTSMMLVRLAVGIMIGCLAAGPLLHRISGKWTIFTGAVGVAITEFCLYFYQMPLGVIHWLLIGAGFFTGLYYVPIATFMQQRPPMGRKGEILAAYNFTNFIGILLGGVTWQILMTFEVPAYYVWWGLSGTLTLLLIIMFPQLKKIE